MKVLVDGDIITYRAGFGSKGDYLMAVELVDSYLLEIFDRFGSDYKIFLSGPHNFRYKVATIQPYKGNRDSSKRPLQYQNVRDYLFDWWGAEITIGIEADDAIGLNYDSDSIIVSIDKDFRTIPNIQYYDLVKKELYFVDEEEAWFNFYTQMLVGDKSDNIPGVRNPLKAHFATPPNFTEGSSKALLGGKSRQEQHELVCEMFEKHYGKDWQKYFDEIATLLWIQRKDAINHNLLETTNV